ncbi:hypothetical protein K1T71_004767 [Dendrolimus kikuchii]|uniref:Uncharacterized protein n=1 Tax=Dendrolimus kikuchii TaxID=765133 RepID=A0ACC1D8D9_9NEOP|nr:hypothetical protein K1T71_004767 [Dendrolimus kikuchii]
MANPTLNSHRSLVVAAPFLAALSLGGTIGYPNTLLQQLQSNSSTIKLDFETLSWIGSIHGFASIPSILMPSLMQWKGRKLSFLFSCLLVAIGWILAYTAQSISTILISESFHGLGSQCVLIVSYCSMSEFLSPKFRNICISAFGIWQSSGIAAIAIIGQYGHWKTSALIMLIPIALGMLIAWLVWPESPSWLALQGRYKECETTFKWLRGDGEKANKELLELIQARKEDDKRESLYKSIARRDFYIPVGLMFLLLSSAYWSGFMVLIVYSHLIVKKTTNDNNLVHYSTIALNILLILGNTNCTILMKRMNNKTLNLIGCVGVLLSSFFCFTVTLLQNIGVLTYSVLCLCGLAIYIFVEMGFLLPSACVIAMEITAVKYRGIGGALFVVFSSLLHFSSLKLAPYMFEYMNLWGTFLVYFINTAVSCLIIWKFVPETRNKTLQELEDYFNHGKFIKRFTQDVTVPII